MKAGSFIAGILIVWLGLRGLTPLRADLFETRNVPNPVIVTVSPFLSDFVIIASIVSRTSCAAFFVAPVACAAPAIKSCFVMDFLVKNFFCKANYNFLKFKRKRKCIKKGLCKG